MVTQVYWREPFIALASVKDAVEYFVLDIEPIKKDGKYCLADAVVAKASDFGHNSITYTVRTHLGHILKPGDMVLGYDLTTSNFNDPHWDEARDNGKNDFADVVLIKKSYAHLRRGQGASRQAGRGWKLKELEKESGEAMTRADEEQAEMDYQRFIEDIEEDPEMRAAINVYRDSNAPTAMDVDDPNDEEAAELPKISLEELLEDLTLNDD